MIKCFFFNSSQSKTTEDIFLTLECFVSFPSFYNYSRTSIKRACRGRGHALLRHIVYRKMAYRVTVDETGVRGK